MHLRFVSFFDTYAIGNQYNQEWNLLVKFAERQLRNFEQNFIVQHTDQHESVHESYQKQNETNFVVSISETFEKKGYHQCIVEIYQNSTKVEFWYLSV